MEMSMTPPLTAKAPKKEKSWREEEAMRITTLLAKLEKHEAECTLRYQRIDERLGEQKLSLKSLDAKIWGLAVLIVIVPLVHKFLG